MQINHLTIQAADGFHLYGLHYGGGHKAVCIFIHGAGNSSVLSKAPLLLPLATALAGIAVDVAAFNNRGSGYAGKISRYDTSGNEIERRLAGTTFELLADCRYDIEGMLAWAKTAGYKTVYLAGHSTGANKIVFYMNTNSPAKAAVEKVFLLAGGDDITLFTQALPNAEAVRGIIKAEVAKGNGKHLLPPELYGGFQPFSYQSYLELLTEHSDYDIFPFGRYSPQRPDPKHFQHFKNLSVGSVCMYGSDDSGSVIPAREAVALLCRLNKHAAGEIIEGADHNFTGQETVLAAAVAKHLGQP